MGKIANAEAKTLPPNRIGEWRQKRGMKLSELEEATGISQSHLSRLINGQRNLSLNALNKLASALDIPTQWLLPEDRSSLSNEEIQIAEQIDAQEAQHEELRTMRMREEVARSVAEMSRVKLAPDFRDILSRDPAAPTNAGTSEPVKFSRDLVPIFGQAAGGPDGRFIMNGERIDSVLRPPSLANVKDAYGVYVYGTSMLDRYEPGEIVFAAPHRPYKAGNYVVVQIHIHGEDMPSGYIKKLVSYTNRELVLLQLNPPEGEEAEMRFPADQVVSIHKIVGTSTD